MNMLCTIPNAICMESGVKQKLVNGESACSGGGGISSQIKSGFIAKYKVG